MHRFKRNFYDQEIPAATFAARLMRLGIDFETNFYWTGKVHNIFFIYFATKELD